MTPADVHELVIEPSSHCNSRCPHCPRFTADGFLHADLPLGHLHPSQLTGLNPDQLAGLRVVTFEGDKGDPVMNPDLLDLVALFPSSVQIFIATNGGIRSTEWWSKLAEFPNVIVNFSIDGLEDTNHVYRINVNWRRVMSNAQAFIDAGGQAVWRCLVFQHNQHQLLQIKELSRNMNFHSVEFRSPHLDRFESLDVWPVMIDGTYSHDLMPTTLSDSEIWSHNCNHKGRLVLPYRARRPVNNSLCPWAVSNKLYINFQAEVLPCCMMHFETLNNYPGRDLFRTLVGNFDRINLQHTTLDFILKNVYGQQLEQSLTNRETMLPVCKKTCHP